MNCVKSLVLERVAQCCNHPVSINWTWRDTLCRATTWTVSKDKAHGALSSAKANIRLRGCLNRPYRMDIFQKYKRFPPRQCFLVSTVERNVLDLPINQYKTLV